MSVRNWEIATYALYLCGGADRPIHTEDVALKCFELSQDGFSWIKHKNYPDKDIARVALTDARKDKHGGLVEGRSGAGKGFANSVLGSRQTDGWKLTENGVNWIKEHSVRMDRTIGTEQRKNYRQENQKKLQRLRTNPMFVKFQKAPSDFSPDIGSVASMMKCRVDANRSVWERRFSDYKNLANLENQQDTMTFLSICEKFVRKEVTT